MCIPRGKEALSLTGMLLFMGIVSRPGKKILLNIFKHVLKLQNEKELKQEGEKESKKQETEYLQFHTPWQGAGGSISWHNYYESSWHTQVMQRPPWAVLCISLDLSVIPAYWYYPSLLIFFSWRKLISYCTTKDLLTISIFDLLIQETI